MQKTTHLHSGKEPAPGYRLRRQIGEGGGGEVWEAESSGGDLIALKFLASESAETVAQEIRAITFVKQLRHPNLTRIDQVWSSRGYVVVAMELGEGSVTDLLLAYQTEWGRQPSAAYVCELLAQAAEGLDFLNKRQRITNGQRVAVQHCDVKPGNLLLFGETVKLCDFGLASQTTSMLKPHRRAGTLDYAAPEVFQGRLSEWTDQYALAVSYYQMRTGELPFPPAAEFKSCYVRPMPDLSRVSSAERPILSRALGHTPQNRWPSCRELMTRLTAAVT